VSLANDERSSAIGNCHVQDALHMAKIVDNQKLVEHRVDREKLIRVLSPRNSASWKGHLAKSELPC
jgi:hypothetical protein